MTTRVEALAWGKQWVRCCIAAWWNRILKASFGIATIAPLKSVVCH